MLNGNLVLFSFMLGLLHAENVLKLLDLWHELRHEQEQAHDLTKARQNNPDYMPR